MKKKFYRTEIQFRPSSYFILVSIISLISFTIRFRFCLAVSAAVVCIIFHTRLATTSMVKPSVVYDNVLTFVRDGPGFETTDRAKFVRHNSLLKRQIPDIVAEGRRAAEFFRRQFGIDFTNLPDEAYVDGLHKDPVTGAMFHPSIFETFGNYRLVQQSSSNPKSSKSYVHAPIITFGWNLNFTQAKNFQSKGVVNSIVPPGSAAFFGDYVIEIWRDNVYQPYSSIYRHSNIPKNIHIHFETRGLFFPPTPPNLSLVFDCIATHKRWGRGNIIGVALPQPGSSAPFPLSRTVITFPFDPVQE